MSARARSVRLSPLAEADLENIWLYTFQRWSPDQADSYHADLVAAFAQLAAGEKSGRPSDVREGYFKYMVGAHVIFYRLSDVSLDVVRILHSRMDVPRHL